MTPTSIILKELEQISKAVAQINRKTPYTVPVGYFETLHTVIMARIAAGGNEENSLLQVAGKEMPQDLPLGYFDTLAENILSKIKTQQEQTVAEELNELSPVLAGLSKTHLYEVPVGYFESQADNLIQQTTTKTKVVIMFSRKLWMQYAAAAVVFGMIAFGINFMLQSPTAIGPVVEIPTIKTEEQFNKELASISEEELISYLKLTADSKDAETIAALVDQTHLPNEAEYMDDAFLESFMKELELTEQKTN